MDAAIIQILNGSANVSSKASAQVAYVKELASNQPASQGRRFADDLPASFLQVFPDPPRRDDEYVHFINDYMPMVLLVSFMLAVASICKDLVSEKEKKLKVPHITDI